MVLKSVIRGVQSGERKMRYGMRNRLDRGHKDVAEVRKPRANLAVLLLVGASEPILYRLSAKL